MAFNASRRLGQCLPLGSNLALNASRRPCRPFAAFGLPCAILWPSAGCLPRGFLAASEATLGSSLALNASRRPCRHVLQPSGCQAHGFGHLSGASTEVFHWLQKATLGSSLALHASLAFCSLRAAQRTTLAICRALAQRLSSGFRKQR